MELQLHNSRLMNETASLKDTANDNHVREHYNSIRNQNRAATKMMSLRDFNNFVKWLLIFEFSNPYDVALDMACGKGGDLEKWRRAGIDGLIGIDIADCSIQDALERYKGMHSKTFWVDFLVGNCFGKDIKTIVHPQALPVNCVSCQFALHYAFDTEERVNRTLLNIKESLVSGGMFFGTTINSEYLADNLRKGYTSWGNKLFKIQFEEGNSNGVFKELTGNKYTFFLREAVANVEEYVVPFDKFTALAKEYGLELVLHEPFLRYFDRNVSASQPVLREAMFKKLTNAQGVPIIDPDQLEICSIYSVFCFRKV